MSFFSVIIPVYNAGNFLSRCLTNLLEQSFTDFEVLLIDDGSPDGSGSVCDSWAAQDSRIRAFHKENGGVTSARNFGMTHAKGNYILFLDQDDYFFPGSLKVIYQALKSCSPGDMLCWAFSSYQTPLTSPSVSLQKFELPEIGQFYTLGTMHYVWTKLFDRKFLLQHSDVKFDETIQDGTDDLPFVNSYFRAFFAAYPAGHIVFLNTPIYYYEANNAASVSRRLQPYQDSHLAMFWDLIQNCLSLCHAPAGDLGPIFRQALHTLAYSLYSCKYLQCSISGHQLFQDRRLQMLLSLMKKHHIFSPFYLPYRWHSASLISFLFFLFFHHKKWYDYYNELVYRLLGSNWKR